MDYENVLRRHGIRITATRLLIIMGIVDYAAPFSLEELYDFLSTIDRSTIFRALTLFEENHLLHSFEDGSGKRKYCLCSGSLSSGDACTADCHHAHATCRICGRTFCVTSENTPPLVAPDGFCVEHANYIITGVCADCLKK